MKNNNQEFPDEIISLLLHQDWSGLKDSQRTQVLLYFTPEEYELLHQAMQTKQVDVHSPKEKLLLEFDQHHQTTSLLNNKVWKIAAMILLFGVAVLQLIILTQHKTGKLVTQIIRDTIFIPQSTTTKPLIKYDTVYLTQRLNKTHHPITTTTNTLALKNKKTAHLQHLQPDVHIVSIDALKEIPNTRRKNSIKADSVFQRISFVTL